jgi:hypothetical protein
MASAPVALEKTVVDQDGGGHDGTGQGTPTGFVHADQAVPALDLAQIESANLP